MVKGLAPGNEWISTAESARSKCWPMAVEYAAQADKASDSRSFMTNPWKNIVSKRDGFQAFGGKNSSFQTGGTAVDDTGDGDPYPSDGTIPSDIAQVRVEARAAAQEANNSHERCTQKLIDETKVGGGVFGLLMLTR